MMFYETNIAKICGNMKDRMRSGMIWFPYPILISVALVTLLLGHLIPSLNTRFSSPAQLMTLAAPKEPEGSIWISIYPGTDNTLHIKTIDREDFSWPITEPTKDDIAPFIKYLRKKVENLQIASGLNNEVNLVKTSAVIASDVKLNFYHIKPILYALSEAKISHYGFETLLPGPEPENSQAASSNHKKKM